MVGANVRASVRFNRGGPGPCWLRTAGASAENEPFAAAPERSDEGKSPTVAWPTVIGAFRFGRGGRRFFIFLTLSALRHAHAAG